MKDKSDKVITAYSHLLKYVKSENIFFPQTYKNKLISNKKNNLCHSLAMFSLATCIGMFTIKTEIALAVNFSNIKIDINSIRTKPESEPIIKIPSIKNLNQKIIPKSSTGINSKIKIIDYKPVNNFHKINKVVSNNFFKSNNNQIIENTITPFRYITKIIQPKISENIENVYTHEIIPKVALIGDFNSVLSQSSIRMDKKSYRVRVGDTLNSIARSHGISTSELISANHITNVDFIKVNQTLIIPQQDSINNTTNRGKKSKNSTIDSFPKKENQFPRSLIITSEFEATQSTTSGRKKLYQDSKKITDQRDLNKNVTQFNVQKSKLIGVVPNYIDVYNNTFQIPLETNIKPNLPSVSNPDKYLPSAPAKYPGHIWPSKGVITSGFGRRWGRMHKGIDIAAPTGTPIMASASGEVISAGWSSGGYGNLLRIRHPDGSISLYAHNSRLLVRRGQKVKQGQKIAEMGSTGFSTGPHLHYEIHLRGKGAQNPMAFLPKTR